MSEKRESDKRESVFRVRPENALGIEADETRSKLISLALSKPENYYLLRDAAISSITKNIAILIYDMYWDILTTGKVPGIITGAAFGSTETRPDKTQLIYPDGPPFSPNLPEKEVNIICSKISDQIKQIGRNVVEEIMPLNHLELARNKQIDILKTRGF